MKSQQQHAGWIVVTGCSSGIGRCVALGLLERGYRVIATCRQQHDIEGLSETGLNVIHLDLADGESVTRAADQILAISNGVVYGLVNNGAYGQPGAVMDLQRHVLREQFETNVFGTQQLTNALLPIMLDNGHGRVIQISSILGFICLRFRGAYNASKYALEALTDTMRLEHAGSGVHFSLIEPGPVRSLFRRNAHQKYQQHIDAESSRFKDVYQRVESRLSAMEEARFTLPPDAVLDAVVHALEKSRPKIRYPVTVPTRVMTVLKRLLPDRMMDRFLLANSDS